MLRTLTGIGIGLALVGSAHAQDRITVDVQGKSPRAVRAEVYRAAEDVCARQDTNAYDASDCVEDTYSNALQQFRSIRLQRAADRRQTLASRAR